jgi:hypothetical protein
MEYICVTNDHGYVPLVVNTSRSFPHSRLITRFVTRLTRRVPLVEQELQKAQKDKQRSGKHTYKTKDRVTHTPLKTGVNSGAPEG